MHIRLMKKRQKKLKNYRKRKYDKYGYTKNTN